VNPVPKLEEEEEEDVIYYTKWNVVRYVGYSKKFV
jgi:hypothetical protein